MCGSHRIGGKFNWIRNACVALTAAVLGIAAPRTASAATNYYTTDYFDVTTYHDTDITKTNTLYSVTINAFLNGSDSVYSETFADPYSDAVVQAGVAAAMTDLTKAGAATITGPTLESSSTTLKSSTTKTVVTGTQKVINPNLGNSPTIVHVGPTTAYLFTGDENSHTTLVGHSFLLLAGKQDIDVMAPLETVIDRTITTTDTFMNDEVYDLFGTVAQSDPTDPTNPGGNTPGGNNPPGNDPPNVDPGNPTPPITPPVTPAVVTAIPLPAAFWPAISMLGVMGLIQLARLRKVSAA
jgi:hypothetical protein